MKRALISDLNGIFAEIAAKKQLFIPSDDGSGQSKYAPWQEGIALTSKLNTVRSAKDLFFPQVENLVKFKVSGKKMEIMDCCDSVGQFVIFGVRACDCKSFDILDSVFLSDPVDTYYQSRRDNGLIITLGCNNPAETCFCGTFGIDASNPAGDISCWMDDNYLFWRSNTEKGAALTAEISFLQECEEAEILPIQKKIQDRMNMMPLHDLDFSGFDGEKMLSFFHSDVWSELSESCLGCGTCTFVCPTCQCYDVQDFDNGREISRFRCWDSCMYSDFTMMAHGTNRPTQKERFRQRFMHKLIYYPNNNNGVFGCVGCGRCLQKCPIHMNIVKVAKKLKEAVK